MMCPVSSCAFNECQGVGAVPMSGNGNCDPSGGITGWGGCALGADGPGLGGPINS